MPVTKKALKRDNSVPAGIAAPMHVDCDCGRPVPITESIYNECDSCGKTYDAFGYIIHRTVERREGKQ